MREGGFDAAFLAVGAHLAKRAYIPAGEAAQDARRGEPCCASMEGEAPPLLGRRVVVYGGGNTALDVARTAKRLGAERGDHRLSPHPREDAGARFRGRGGARGGRARSSGCRPSRTMRRRHADGREDGARRQGLSAADRRVRDARGRFAGAGARPGRRSVAARQRARPRRSKDGVVKVGPQHDDRHAGIFAGGDMVPVRAHRHGRRRPRQEGGAPHRRLAARRGLRARAQA